jgi:adenylate kinase family enzyme
VIGGPGAGKSSFAAAVADCRSLRLHHLDELAFAGPDFDPRPDDVIRAEVQALAEEGRWVAEGIFVGWVEPLFERADVIVWLDHVTWLQAARRIAARWFSGAVRESSLRRGTERFFRFHDYARNLRHLVRVLATSREYWTNAGAPRRYQVTRAQVDTALAPHADKLVHVTRPDEAETVLHLIRSNSGS